MSLTPRQFIREFRPLFRLLDEPFARPSNSLAPTALFNEPFFNRADFGRNLPAVDLTEHESEFVVDAELPGVKKENIDIRIGDGGQSLTIEGKSFVKSSTSSNAQPETPAATPGQPAAGEDKSSKTEGSQAVTQTDGNRGAVGTPLSSERFFSSTSSFSRTVWLPRRVDGSKVKAKLEDGVLTVKIPKAVDPESVRVTID
ncbi:HSP20-like chaperone [Schizopora paradoxa]|uniref:HSP20-like chaperone n=1 Tax=Schizopora paradoxa TaxID=27342 RepID=A0A0H2SQ87_9AGAM|nr:HSP20-like chaperone [Schizopora paradoxa]